MTTPGADQAAAKAVDLSPRRVEDMAEWLANIPEGNHEEAARMLLAQLQELAELRRALQDVDGLFTLIFANSDLPKTLTAVIQANHRYTGMKAALARKETP